MVLPKRTDLLVSWLLLPQFVLNVIGRERERLINRRGRVLGVHMNKHTLMVNYLVVFHPNRSDALIYLRMQLIRTLSTVLIAEVDV